MTPTGRGWNEASLSEDPAVALLQKFGYYYVAPEALEAERGSLKDVIVSSRLGAALRKLNPWLSDDNVNKAIRSVTHVQAASLVDANEKLYTTLTYGIAVEQDRGDGQGRRNHTVRFFDFERPEANEFVVTRQYRVQAARGHHIKPDVVLLVNGIPLVVIECKSPTLGEKWFEEAFDQVDRYQELRAEYREVGAPKLFETVQAIVICCQQDARYGTVGTQRRFYADWKTTYPLTDAAVERDLGRKPSRQDVLFYGMLRPENLLDIVRSFVAFEDDATMGRTVRKVCRYQQYAAVNKAITRAKTGKKTVERGGVVWHTQGSGKSLTMLWLALKLRRDSAFENPTLVVVTDRRDLDEQIAKTFVACGFPNPERADSVRNLRDLLTGPPGKTIMTTVQKFQELAPGANAGGKRRVARSEFPTLSTSANIFVLADEAHRTQYGGLAANLRQALPNGCFLGFTGTPIDKKDRSTLSTFGPYIDTYTIEQAVKDGATVPIFYESRLPDVRVIGQTLDKLFDHVFADRSEEERAVIKKKYATHEAVAEAPRRIETICLDLIEHYTKFIQPNGFKAQIVACSREAAATYKETLDRLQAPASALIISSSHNDEERLTRYSKTPEERKALIEKFCKKDDPKPLSILVVCDMLLTGFDAPVEQVMYLDSPLREHTLLQAIARVNRTADGKDYGLVVDYWGVSEDLQKALAIFSPTDIQGAMVPKDDELPRLQARHAAAMKFFAKVKDKNDLDQCVVVLEPEDVRAEFNVAFRRFNQSLDMLLPDPKGLAYVGDMKWLGKIRAAAAARFRDDKLDVSDCGAKVRKLIEDAIVADGIQVLVERVSLFSNEFSKKLDKLKTDEARASEMEHAIRREIHVKLDENPAFYQSLRQRLEQIIADQKAERLTAAEQLKLLDVLAKELRGTAEAAEALDLTPRGYAIYGLLDRELPLKAAEKTVEYNESTRELASLIDEAIAPQAAIVDWSQKDDVQREMRARIKKQLKAARVDASKLDGLAQTIVDLAKARKGK